jgi:hypothetical protein
MLVLLVQTSTQILLQGKKRKKKKEKGKPYYIHKLIEARGISCQSDNSSIIGGGFRKL